MDSEIVNRLYKRLQVTPAARGTVGRFDLDLQYLGSKEQLFAATAVFYGGNYVPNSVREAVQATGLSAGREGAEVRLFVDELSHQVILAYKARWGGTDRTGFDQMVEDFLEMAEEWRRLLDEYGDQDLIRVPKP